MPGAEAGTRYESSLTALAESIAVDAAGAA